MFQFSFRDFTLRISNSARIYFIRRADIILMNEFDLSKGDMILETDSSTFIGTSDTAPIEGILDQVDILNNGIRLDKSGQICRGNSPCFDIRNKKILFRKQNDKIVLYSVKK